MESIIVLNLGSTSFKFKLFDMEDGEKLRASGSVDAIGSGNSILKLDNGTETVQETMNCPNHDTAFHACMDFLTRTGILSGMKDIAAVGYKAVLIDNVTGAQPVTDALIQRMEELSTLAPAHNPIYTAVMKQVRESEPQLKQFACFETGFHTTIPQKRRVYGVPLEWTEWGIRRYGFHGASHSYIAQKVRSMYPDADKMVSVHLGGSCSICAIQNGKSVASSMGATPQSGLFHNNRVGDFDIFCLPLLLEHYGTKEKVLQVLGNNSGLLGLSGISNDMRRVEDAALAGNERAKLAREAFCDAITGYIGMDTAFMGGLDTIVFTGGIGEHSPYTRAKSLETLGYLGVKLDETANTENREMISAPDSAVRVLVLETNEEIMVARQVAQCLHQQG